MEYRLFLPGLAVAARSETPPREVPGGVLVAGREVTLHHTLGLTRFYRHGWQSWSPTAWVELGTPPMPIEPPIRRVQAEDPVYAASPAHGGSGLGALEGRDGRVLLLGALGIGARVEADRQALRGFYEEGTGEWFVGYGEEETVFARYADLLREHLGWRSVGPPPRVWCSWYSYYQAISEEVLLRILNDLRGFPFDVFQIDDGWQLDVGDWAPNARFPSGMEAIARRIEAAGFLPGLWLAPFLVRPSSRLCRERPEWLLRDAQGQPVVAGFNWGGVTYALDVTHPDVSSWLVDLFRQVRGWGYRYLKLDFLYAGALPGVRHRVSAREVAYRNALAAVRDAVPDAYILACGAPILASLGIADALRVGPDSAPFWGETDDRDDRSRPAALNALRTTLHRLWLLPLVHVDPDVVYFRSRDTQLTPRQRALLQDLALITGYKGTSDPPAWLDQAEREALRHFLQWTPRVRRLGRCRFALDDREEDFSEILATL